MIDFIQPYSFDGEIGTAYNKAVDKCNEWICITDQDTLKPPGFAERIKKVIDHHGRKDIMLGAMTNRIGWNHPAAVEGLVGEQNINQHLKEATQRWKMHGTDITPCKIIPGYCMVFHKDYWIPWPPKTFTFDKQLSRKFPNRSFIMKGVYIFHLYRWGSKRPELKTEHLIQGGYNV